MTGARVAIPFSSGLCSFYALPMAYQNSVRSQSLFHQVCVRSHRGPAGPPSRAPSQSLFHQVCVRSLRSGRCFPMASSRNPFFIRSVFVLEPQQDPLQDNPVAIPFSSGLCSFEVVWRLFLVFGRVAIPFSSGLCSFTACRMRSRRAFLVAIPFSSGLCSFALGRGFFCSLSGRNPFFIRSVFVLPYGPSCAAARRRNPFFIRSVFVRSSDGGSFGPPGRNPFFIRSVFVLQSPATVQLPERVAIPFSSGLCSFRSSRLRRSGSMLSQSLFHQVCVRSPVRRPVLPYQLCRNPFFIRSVFVHPPHSTPRPYTGRNPFFIRSVFVR